jgi:SAM-dependent methyltransferase
VTNDYLLFGKDYYDNASVLQGFGGYTYDGRYEECVKEFVTELTFRTILDFGCAKGFLLYEFYKKGKMVLGVETSSYARENAKEEIANFIYDDLNSIPEKELATVEVIVSRDVLPHLTQAQVQTLLSTVQNKCKNLILFYIELPVSSEACSEKDLLDWDPTHKTIASEEYWNDIFSAYQLPIEAFYKNLFD